MDSPMDSQMDSACLPLVVRDADEPEGEDDADTGEDDALDDASPDLDQNLDEDEAHHHRHPDGQRHELLVGARPPPLVVVTSGLPKKKTIHREGVGGGKGYRVDAV